MSTQLRPELTQSAVFSGTTLFNPEDIIERRGGRILPGVAAAESEYTLLLDLSQKMASRAILDIGLLVPAPKQLERITLAPEMGCWELPVYIDPLRARYGVFSMKEISSTSRLAHRTMYQIFFGIDSLPNGRADFLDHICENKTCCYPRHLEKVTAGENTRRGRISTDESHPRLDFYNLGE
ncbi:MAG TPA: HNH endonuclease [Candidatus Saccharimonadaceae bacterium]|nr:HNH endonuclease [Candidatus Saccharimonadaceae bacterium]